MNGQVMQLNFVFVSEPSILSLLKIHTSSFKTVGDETARADHDAFIVLLATLTAPRAARRDIIPVKRGEEGSPFNQQQQKTKTEQKREVVS